MTQARYVSYGSSAAYMEQYTSATVSDSRCAIGCKLILSLVSKMAEVGCVHHTVLFSKCSFVANTALGQSGVLGLISGLTTSVVGCNFTANASPDGIGSGVFAVSQTSSFTVANSTFVKNGGTLSLPYACISASEDLHGGLQPSNLSCVWHNSADVFPVAPASAQGAVSIISTPVALLQNNTFEGNEGTAHGSWPLMICSHVYTFAPTCASLPYVHRLIMLMCGWTVSAAAGGGGGTSTGAAIYFYSSCGQLCSVIQSVFTGNTVTGANADGAAVYADTPGNLTITDNMFATNTAGLR